MRSLSLGLGSIVLVVMGVAVALDLGACSKGDDHEEPTLCDLAQPGVCPEGQVCTYGDWSGSPICLDPVCARATSCCNFKLDGEDCRMVATAGDAACLAYVRTARDSGTCFDDPSLPGGNCMESGSCGYDQQCCSSHLTCQSGSCTTCEMAGASCDRNVASICCQGLYCEPTTMTCKPREDIGGPCELDTDCASYLVCVGAACDNPREAGQSCVYSDDCHLGLNCVNQVCTDTSSSSSSGGTTSSSSGGSCNSTDCSGSQTSCSDGFCFSCYFYCAGSTCASQCTD